MTPAWLKHEKQAGNKIQRAWFQTIRRQTEPLGDMGVFLVMVLRRLRLSDTFVSYSFQTFLAIDELIVNVGSREFREVSALVLGWRIPLDAGDRASGHFAGTALLRLLPRDSDRTGR